MVTDEQIYREVHKAFDRWLAGEDGQIVDMWIEERTESQIMVITEWTFDGAEEEPGLKPDGKPDDLYWTIDLYDGYIIDVFGPES
jgi:hypothetical protein